MIYLVCNTVPESHRRVSEEWQFLGVSGYCGDLEEVAKILLANTRVQVERVLQQVQYIHNAQLMSASDYFETIDVKETKQDLGSVVAVFEGDITCPDGTVLAPGEVWKLRNIGPNKWLVGAVFSCVGGDKMQAPESVLIPSVLPGKSIDVSLRMVAPAKACRHIGYWLKHARRQSLWATSLDPATVAPDTKESEVYVSELIASTGDESLNNADVPAEAAITEDPRWASQLQVLDYMGFTDKPRNASLLSQHNGNTNAVITGLLS
ncbi:hypothetical protein PsorP6_009482 [Peronosclerospora sorghi]|uniref:Uncharacterized protein n=1 Tax=Peronosclerospora sorghi TaxID=230839 RepID=A0ACC0VZ25_9STRA|nr:hypothetical protein PsorP6_009482 [Peronosclerospora sorghi]